MKGLHSARLLMLVALLVLPGIARGQAAKPGTPGAGQDQEKPAGENRDQLAAEKLSKVPKQTKFVEAEYPPEAAAQQIEAEVILLLDIDDTGKVTAVAVAQPATVPDMGFEEAALIAAHQFVFEPAEIDGKPIAVQLSYRYRFELKPQAPEPAPEATPADGTPSTDKAPAKPARDPVRNFSGVLRERGTRLLLPGVLVTVFRDDGEQPVGYEATTSAEGRFEFFDLQAGPWKILIESPGYYPFRTTETIVEGEATDVTYYAEKASYNPYDVTVTASRPRKEVSRTVISVKEAIKIPGTAGDPLAVIQNFAGVARVPAFNGLVIIRGSAPEDSRIFVDGVEVPNIYHFGGLRSVIPDVMLDAIDFFPGNFGPQYGRATGGVIDVRTKDLAPKKVSGHVDVSLLDTSLSLAIPISDKASIALAGRRSYVDFILEAAIPEDSGINVIAAPRYYDYQLLAKYQPAPAHDLRLFVFGSDDALEFLFTSPGQLDLDVTSGRFTASQDFIRTLGGYRYTPSTSFSNNLRLSTGRDRFNFKIGQLRFDLDIEHSQLRDNVEHKLNDWLTLNYGVDITLTHARGFINLPPPPKEGEPMGQGANFDLGDTRTTDFSEYYFSPAAFFEAEVKPVEQLQLFPGVRVDHFSRIDQSVVSPRMTARYQAASRVVVKAGVGLFQQEPFFDETNREFGNPDLDVEKAIHYSAGVEYRPLPYISLDATTFYKDLWNQVSPTDELVTENGVTRPLFYDNNGKGRVYGLEMVLRHEFTKRFTGWLAYTLSRAERTDSGEAESRRFDFDQPHILTIIATYLLPRNWQIGSRFRLVSGNPITPIIGNVYNASADRYNAIFGAPNSGRNGAFHQLDLRIDKRWIYDRWTLNAYLDIQNIYNRSNPEGSSYNYNFTLSEPQQGLPIFPILGLRGEF